MTGQNPGLDWAGVRFPR